MTGGELARYDYFDSTELLVEGAASWTEAGPLPSTTSGLRGVSIDNSVIVTGRHSETDVFLCNDTDTRRRI